MTTRTVTVQEEKEVEVCDECGLGEDVEKLYDVSVAGEECLHLHESCVKDYQEEAPMNWQEAHANELNLTNDSIIAFVFNKVTFSLFLISFSVLVSSVTTIVLIPNFIWSVMFAIAGAFICLFIVLSSFNAGKNCIEEFVN